MRNKTCVVVGAGLAGATAAWKIDMHPDWTVKVYEAMPEVGGQLRMATLNRIPYEPHGPHIFHTDNLDAFMALGKHGALNTYQHHVLSELPDGRRFTWPLQKSELKNIPEWRQIAAELDNRPLHPTGSDFETYAVSLMGRTLYEWFCEGYTMKQWGMDPRRLSSSFAPKRLDLRIDDDRRMFRNKWQGWMPGGFQQVVESMLAGIEIQLGQLITFSNLPDADAYVITSPLDTFLERDGMLPWRGVRSVATYYNDHLRHLAAPVVNRPDPHVPFTREVDTSQMAWHDATKRKGNGTIIVREYPGAPVKHYPVDDAAGENRSAWREMRQLVSELLPTAVLAGRLATYTYIDMDAAITQGLNAARRVLGPR